MIFIIKDMYPHLFKIENGKLFTNSGFEINPYIYNSNNFTLVVSKYLLRIHTLKQINSSFLKYNEERAEKYPLLYIDEVNPNKEITPIYLSFLQTSNWTINIPNFCNQKDIELVKISISKMFLRNINIRLIDVDYMKNISNLKISINSDIFYQLYNLPTLEGFIKDAYEIKS